MKNVIAVFALVCFSVVANAEPVSKSVSTDVVDISCMPGSSVCDITMSNGSILSEEQDFLTRYLPVAQEKGASEDALFIYNNNNEIIGLNPKTFGEQASTQQPVQQQASEPPYKLESGMNQFGATLIHVVSMSSQLTVQQVTVNEGNCKVIPNGKKFPKTVKMGESASVVVAATCNIVKIDVVTDQGSWTHTIR